VKIVPIFAPRIYAIKVGEQDVFEAFMALATDTEMLYNYFKQENGMLNYYNTTLANAVSDTMDAALRMYDNLKQHAAHPKVLFQPLTHAEPQYSLTRFKHKAKWIRLYAIGVNEEQYIITGGAIKQSQRMQDHPETNKQLQMLNQTKRFLLAEGICDESGLIELISTQ
jgi:hypothetical protein